MLQELLKDSRYLKIASWVWGENRAHVFVQPVENGLNLSKNLEEIRRVLAGKILQEKTDTAFISLGGAAKILCVELAGKLNVRCIDFGSILRALTYSGSAGHAAWRASHAPFFFRVPFGVYMDAYERAHPDAPPETLLLKAHAQLCLELQEKIYASSTPSDVITPGTYDPNPENIESFNVSVKEYRRRYSRLRKLNVQCRSLSKEFDWWMTKKELNRLGKVRGFLRRCNRRLRDSK